MSLPPPNLCLKDLWSNNEVTSYQCYVGRGLCISYDRPLAFPDIANSVCAQFEKNGVACPPEL